MKMSRFVWVAPVVLIGMGSVATAQQRGWDGAWSGLLEGKSAVSIEIADGKVTDYRLQGLKRPVEGTKLQGAGMTFDVRMNGEMSTVVLMRNDHGASVELISPGGTRSEGVVQRLGDAGAVPPKAVDPLTTGSTPRAVPKK
jgi:hypothetical protein